MPDGGRGAILVRRVRKTGKRFQASPVESVAVAERFSARQCDRRVELRLWYVTFSVFKNVDEMNVGDRYARMLCGCGRKYPKAGSPAGVPMHVLEMCTITGTRILAGPISSAVRRLLVVSQSGISHFQSLDRGRPSDRAAPRLQRSSHRQPRPEIVAMAPRRIELGSGTAPPPPLAEICMVSEPTLSRKMLSLIPNSSCVAPAGTTIGRRSPTLNGVPTISPLLSANVPTSSPRNTGYSEAGR